MNQESIKNLKIGNRLMLVNSWECDRGQFKPGTLATVVDVHEKPPYESAPEGPDHMFATYLLELSVSPVFGVRAYFNGYGLQNMFDTIDQDNGKNRFELALSAKERT